MPTPTSSSAASFHTPLDIGTATAQAIEDRLSSLDAAETAGRALASGEATTRAAADTAEASARTSATSAITTRVDIAHDATGNLKPLIVAASNIAAAVTAPASIVWDVFNKIVPVGVSFFGRARWYPITSPGTYLSIVDAATSSNPLGTPTLRYAAAAGSTLAGKKIHVAELGLQPGDICRFGMLCKTATGTISLNASCFTSADALIGSPVTVASTPAGGVVPVTTGDVTIAANTSYVVVYVKHESGTAADVDIYALWGVRGQYISIYPPGNDGYPLPQAGENSVWDPFNREYYPGMDFGGQSRWHLPAGYTGVLYPDATNPYAGATVTISASAAQPGKKIYLREVGLVAGDPVAFSATLASAGGASMVVRCGFWTAARTLISSVISPTTVLTSTPVVVSTPLAAIPATTDYILVTTERSGVATPASLYAMWGGRGGATALPEPSHLTAGLIAGEAALNLHEVGRSTLRQWRAKVAGLLRADAGTKAVINLVGDSWFQRDIIRNPLTDYLVSLYGDAGSGYIGAVFGSTYPYNWTSTRTGPWSGGANDVDIDTDATAKGVDGTHSVMTSTSDVWVVTATVTDFVVHYRNQIGGGDFTVQIDGGSTTSFTTDVAASYAAITVNAGALGSHTLTIRCTVTGSQGVLLCGVEALKNQNGVRVNKLGNGGTTAPHLAAASATDIQTALTALGGDVTMILLATNDRTQAIPPATYTGSLLTLVDRLQIALPLGDIVLVAPGDVTTTTTFATSAYAAAMRHVCTLRQHVGFVSIYDLMNPVADNVSRGVMDGGDQTHPNALGGQVIANRLSQFLSVR
jgi:lysophospholipase L1-like esterase